MQRGHHALALATLLGLTLAVPAGCADDDGGNGSGGEGDGDSESAGDGDGDGDGDSGTAGDGDGDGDSGGGDGDGDGDGVPSTYTFESRFAEGESSVAYSGQTFRHALIESMKAEISAVQADIDDQTIFTEGEVAGRLRFYYDFDSATSGILPHLVSTTPAPLQATWDDISSDKDLRGKIAGNDATGQHKDWATEMMGWDGMTSPDALMDAWFDQVDEMAVAYSSGIIPTDPTDAQIGLFYVSADGLDYQQLIQKFALGAIAFSQGVDDYLDNDLDDKGLNSDNTAPVEGKTYTALEHQWDEAFGYFGAARNYLAYDDGELAGVEGREEFMRGHQDADGDGSIDLGAEYNFGASVNAGKRDYGSADGAETDMTEETMQAFLAGRHILASSSGALTEEQMTALVAQRDIAILGWEKALAATAIHYFNDTLKDMRADPYVFTDHAKHWSELKGFLLSLQFNPRSPLTDEDFAAIHERVGMAPALPNNPEADAYADALVEARDLLAAAYGFEAANLGDENGEGGW